MSYFRKPCILLWFFKGFYFHFPQRYIKFSKSQLCDSFPNIFANPKFYHGNAVQSQNCQKSAEKCGTTHLNSVGEAEEAIFDYLYWTRSLPYIHADYMSTNSPIFLQKLLEKVCVSPMIYETRKSIIRYLRYHPINEFEPFFESSGLKPSEFLPILPRNLIYLADYNMLLENYTVLCNYGIPRNKIGNIYMKATEIFGYDHCILESKLRAFENMGLHRSSVCEFVTSTPIILIDDGSVVKFVKAVNNLGIRNRFIEAQFKIGESYDLTRIVGVLCFFSRFCCSQEQVQGLLMQHPDFLFEDSGNNTFSLIGFLFKCGLTIQEILSLFLQFPHIKVGKFIQNARKCYDFLIYIDMEEEDIKRIVQSHTLLIGSCSLKVPYVILNSLGLGKSQTRKIVIENPGIMIKWVFGSKIKHISIELTEVRQALLDYLHCTRCLPLIHAEHMSNNSPIFLQMLLENVRNVPMSDEIGNSITHYLNCHPINEFEPFFESSGLKHFEFFPIISRNCLMHLTDDKRLLENYSVLCSFGIPRNKIGRIYIGATEVFSYDHGILESKLQAFEDMGLNRSSVCMLVTSSPIILVDNGNIVRFLNVVNTLGINNSFIDSQLLIGKTYNWTQIVGVLDFFSKLGCNPEQLRKLFMQHPDFLFEDSGHYTFSLVGFLLKYGLAMNEILSLFLQFPRVRVGKFIQNARRCCYFLTYIDMEDEDIERFVQSHAVLIGSCALKAPEYILKSIGLGRKQTCEILKEPKVMMKWVLGSKIKPYEGLSAREEKADFFIKLGFVKGSGELERVMNVIGKGCRCSVSELDDRVKSFVKAGWDLKDVVTMLKSFPGLLNQSKESFERKINVLVGDFGIPLSPIMRWPWCLFYALPKLKLRLSMYCWHQNQGASCSVSDKKFLQRGDLKLSSLIGVSDEKFISRFVAGVPRGADVWEEFRKKIY